jgi:hypothetical protein
MYVDNEEQTNDESHKGSTAGVIQSITALVEVFFVGSGRGNVIAYREKKRQKKRRLQEPPLGEFASCSVC